MLDYYEAILAQFRDHSRENIGAIPAYPTANKGWSALILYIMQTNPTIANHQYILAH